MKERKGKKNFKLYEHYSYYVPGVADIFILFAWLLLGALLGNMITLVFVPLTGNLANAAQYANLVAYPLMFVPVMIYAGIKSMANSSFGTGFKLNNKRFKPLGALFCVILCIFGTLATSFVGEPIITLLPEMPAFLKEALDSVTQGNFLVNFLCVSIFAPFFEEWLCRGMVLRGLLNNPIKKKDGTVRPGMKPVWAIVISAVFFALIHLNPWQAIPAFLMGCFFGYVYYKTGSLWLTMLMHFTNNTFAVVISHLDKFKDIECWKEVLQPGMYWALYAFCLAVILYVVSKFRTVESSSSQGNCEELISKLKV